MARISEEQIERLKKETSLERLVEARGVKLSPPVLVGTRITGITDAHAPAGGAPRGSPLPPIAVSAQA